MFMSGTLPDMMNFRRSLVNVDNESPSYALRYVIEFRRFRTVVLRGEYIYAARSKTES